MNASSMDIITIRGAPGSGKTLVSKCLAARYPQGVRIEVDSLRAMVISVDWTNQAEHSSILSLSTGLVLGFLKRGFRPVIVVDTFSGNKLESFLADLRSADGLLDVRSFALVTAPAVLRSRVEGRPADQFKDLGVCEKLNADVPKHAQPLERIIDNSHLTPEETAEEMFRWCQNPGAIDGVRREPMHPDLGRRPATRLSGTEQFHDHGAPLGFDVLGFWQWSASDLLSNTMRGIVAEYIVAQALGVPHKDVRIEWAAHDLKTAGGVRVEVKSASYLQSWAQQKPSTISFSTRMTRGWDPETNGISPAPRHHADVYVLALLAHQDKSTVDPLDVSQWAFYVLPTRTLEEQAGNPQSVTLGALERLGCRSVPFAGLRAAVEAATRTLSGQQ